jgi:hypothetical protein
LQSLQALADAQRAFMEAYYRFESLKAGVFTSREAL